MIFTLSAALVLMAGLMTWSFQNNLKEETPVFNETEVPVITLPDTQSEETAKRPYSVEAQLVLKYFDENNEGSDDVTLFEGKYRPNEGCDYSFNDEAFDVLAVLSGEVTDVKEDPMFGNSVSIKSGDVTITYQSLKDLGLKKGDQVKQGDVISQAAANIYNKDLNNHVHIVVEKNGVTINPESIYDKALSEIK